MSKEYESPPRWVLKNVDGVYRLHVRSRPVTKAFSRDVAEAVSDMCRAQHKFLDAKWDFDRAVRNADAALKPYMRRRVVMSLEDPYMNLVKREEKK